ncbi:phosphonoacetaldehyde hydrolase [Salmonella enterica subsp. enterica]|uniref:Phosphonoacetaldehyde hydrolase n=1 Tax=Salmonella enterica I TaxID=59201 RepID=A0A447U8U3_SALET|nr:phosphonoacetaldehyde hydrolase [Salmonella enterica subsp. enterica]
MRSRTAVKVDDAAPGISEGLNAGMWTVGLAVSGNEFGATWDAYQTMSKEDVAVRREHAASKAVRRRGALRGGFTGGFT